LGQKILLLEDDKVLGSTIKELLSYEGYEVTHVLDGGMASEASYNAKYDLYVFDINVPEISGLELLESLRDADDRTPAIFISALVDLETISKGFEVGADDYIKKPFAPEELLIRINAKLSLAQKVIHIDDLEYDLKTKVLKKDGAIIALGEVQERIFELLVSNINKVVDKDLLLDCLEKPSAVALRTAITKLKQKTGIEVKNLRGIGYTIEQS
jgi:DNA-binding response OmpR family regulator